MSHPSADLLLDAALGLADPPEHLRACAACRSARLRLEEEQAVLRAHYSASDRRPDLEEKIMNALPRSATTRVRAATRSTRRVTATERFHATAGRGWNPARVLIGAIAAAFLVVVGVILLVSEDDAEFRRHQADRALRAAYEAEGSGRFDEALSRYREALDHLEGDERFRTRVIEIRRSIRDASERKAVAEKGAREFSDFQAAARACPDAEADRRLADGRALRDRYRGISPPWMGELDASLERLSTQADRFRVSRRIVDPIDLRSELMKRHGLEGREGHWSAAIRAWKEYQSGNPSEAHRARAEEEIRRLHLRARDELHSVRRRVGLLVEEGKRAEAVALLKSLRARFEATDSAASLEAAIAEVDR